MLIEGSKWFSVDHGQLGNALVSVKKEYKKWNSKSKSYSSRLRKNFSFEKMQTQLLDILDSRVDLPKNIELNLPKKSLPKLDLPKLQIVK